MNTMADPFLSLGILIGALRRSVADWGVRGVLGAALMLLLHRRLGEIAARMERLAARFRAGRLWRVVNRAAPAGSVARRQAGRAAAWPGRFGWLVRLAAYEAAGFGSQLRAMLAQPEMRALLAAAPQAARALRPLCRMLAVETDWLRPEADAAVPVGAVPGRAVIGRTAMQRVALVVPPGAPAATRRVGRVRD